MITIIVILVSVYDLIKNKKYIDNVNLVKFLAFLVCDILTIGFTYLIVR